jgi:NAD(P)H-hydrate epimerase
MIEGSTIQAELTVTFAAAKLGHVLMPAAAQVGDLVVVDIGIPEALSRRHQGRHRFVAAEDAVALLPDRPRDGHKGTFGHLLVVAGSAGKTGAAVLAAEAGLRSGAGLTTLACPASLHDIFACKLTEVMTAPLADQAGSFAVTALPELLELCASKEALVIGPGLGTAVATGSLLRGLLAELKLPVLLDADALNLCGTDHPYAHRPIPAVLTPHPGEMARLLGITVAEVQADRLATARRFAETHGVVLILKGAQTVVAAPDGILYLNSSGNPLLASGGTGDALAGLIGGLLAQGLAPVDAAVLGVFWHGFAADRLRDRIGEAGLLAGELSCELPAARRALEATD